MKISISYMVAVLSFLFVAILQAESTTDAGNYNNFNIKIAGDANKSDVLEGSGSFIELEAIFKQNSWNFYGFSDFRFSEPQGVDAQDRGVNMDFYKYILSYDLIDNRKLFLSAEIKETYSDFKGDSFIGVGSSIDIPVFGQLLITGYYFAGSDSLNKSASPYSLQFAWYNQLANLGKGWTLSHGGWSDFDFFNQLKNNASTTGTSIQIYEGISFNYSSYSIELGYELWLNSFGIQGETSNSVFVYLIKRF